MPKALVIAEKPSVAADLARALGKVPKKNDLFENDEFVITSAIGHLVELCLPGEMDKKRGKWSFANLPIIPDHFDLKPIEKTQARFNSIKRLLKRADRRRGHQRLRRRPRGRIDISLSHEARGQQKAHSPPLAAEHDLPRPFAKALARSASGAEMAPLADAAVCRSESDWLVGINGTRAMTAFNSKGGGFQLTPVGRVQTPTLAILSEREVGIRNFKPRTYFEVFGDFRVTTASGSPASGQARTIAADGSTRSSGRTAARTRGPNAFGKGSKPRRSQTNAPANAAP